MVSVEVVTAILRFLCIAPLGMYSYNRVVIFSQIVKHSHVLLAPPLNYSVVMAAEQFAGVWGVIMCIWNFIMCGAYGCCEDYFILILLIPIVDTLFVIFLLLATIFESHSIRKSPIRCNEIFTGPASDAGTLFFQRFKATVWEEESKIRGFCHDFNLVFYIVMAVMALYAIIIISEFWFAIGEAWPRYSWGNIKYRWKRSRKP